MKSKQLNHISKIIAGQSPPSSTYNYTGEGFPFFQGKTDFQEKYPTARMWCTSVHRKESYPGDILISVRAPVGAVNICNQKSIIGRGLAAIRPNADTYGLYLYYYLKANEKQIDALGTGSTFKAITQDTLKKIEIPTPSFDDQKRIAHLLDTVDGLISDRKRHLQQLDALLQSVFMEMFGDPVRNEKGWEKLIFSQLLDDIESGHSPKCEAREANEAEWGVLKLGAVTSCFFKEYENKALPDDISPKAQHEVKAGDVLFSRKNTYELVAACAYVFEARPKLLLPDLIFRFKLKKDAQVNPIFLWKLLVFETQRGKIQSLASGAAGSMPNISKTNLKQVLLPRPPLPLQNKFAAIVEKVEGIKQHYQHSLGQLENLYGVLSQKAFKGELDLSRVVLPVEAVLPVLQGSAPRDTSFDLEEIAQLGYGLAQFAHQAAQAIVPLLVPLAAVSIGFQRGLQDAARALQHSKTSKEISFSPPMPAAEAIENLCHEKRTRDIDEILENCIKELGAVPFSVQEFLDAVRRELEDIADDPEQVQGVTLVVYENIKAWIFRSLERGSLKQFFDKIDNAVYFRHVDAV